MSVEVTVALISVCGVIAASIVVVLGQRAGQGVDLRRERFNSIVEQCAQVIAAERDFRGRVRLQPIVKAQDAVRDWEPDIPRLAFARLQVLLPDVGLKQAALRLRRAGERLGDAVLEGSGDVQAASDEHRAALYAFEQASAEFVEQSM